MPATHCLKNSNGARSPAKRWRCPASTTRVITLNRWEQRDAWISGFLEALLRSVFRNHPPEAIWAGHFIPKTEDRMLAIKKYACKAIYSAQSSDNSEERGNMFLRPFQCLPWPRRHNSQANNTSANRQRGDAASAEEGIPLKTGVLSSGPQAESDCGVTKKDSHDDTRGSWFPMSNCGQYSNVGLKEHWCLYKSHVWHIGLTIGQRRVDTLACDYEQFEFSDNSSYAT